MRRAQRPHSLTLALVFAAGLAQAQTPPAAVTPPPPPSETAPALQLREPQWPASPPRRTSNVRSRLRLLDQSLIPMAERSHDGRVPSAIGSLVAGGVLTTIGGLTYDSAAPSNAASTYLVILGGVEIASGIIQLAWPPARERITAQYRAMPRRTAAERRAAMRFGEQSFDDIAADGARRRVLSSLLNVGLSVSLLGVIYSPQIFDGQPWPEPPAANYLVLGLTGVAVITGLFAPA